MRTINGYIKVGGRSRQNQSIGLTHGEERQPGNSQQPSRTSVTANIRADTSYLLSGPLTASFILNPTLSKQSFMEICVMTIQEKYVHHDFEIYTPL